MSSVLQPKVAIGGSGLVYAFEVTGGTANTTAEMTFDRIVGKSQVGQEKKGAVTYEITSHQADQTTFEYIDSRITSSPTEPIKVDYENGDSSTVSQASDSTIQDLFAVPYPLTGVDTKRRVFFGLGILSGDSGNISSGFNALNEAPLAFTTVQTKTAITIPAATVSLVCGVSTTLTIPTGAFGLTTFL
jgi:hypothetical protein